MKPTGTCAAKYKFFDGISEPVLRHHGKTLLTRLHSSALPDDASLPASFAIAADEA